MTEHRSLTGDDLHEPKDIASAAAGRVYVSDGSGSGVWTDRFAGILSLNKFTMNGTVPDVSTTNSSFFLYVPLKASLTRISTVLNSAITTGNAVLTIYKNGIAQTPTITIPFTGSGAGIKSNTLISPAITFNDGDTLEIRTDGGSDTTAALSVTAMFTAI